MKLYRKYSIFFINLLIGLAYISLCFFDLISPGYALVHNLVFFISFFFAIPALLILFLPVGWIGWALGLVYIVVTGYFIDISWKKPRRILNISIYIFLNIALFALETYLFFEYFFMGGTR
jgi:hypothetical protein